MTRRAHLAPARTSVALALAALARCRSQRAALRPFFTLGIPASGDMPQHLILVAGMLGAAVAARENRLLSLSTLPLSCAAGRWRPTRSGGCPRHGGGAAVRGGAQFVTAEEARSKLVTRPAAVVGAADTADRVSALIALRLTGTRARAGEFAPLALAVALLCRVLAASGRSPRSDGLGRLCRHTRCAILGAPVFVALGGAALLLFWGEDCRLLPLRWITIAWW